MQIGMTRGRAIAGIAIIAVAALVAGAGLAAQGRGGGSFGGTLRHLDLTEDQRASIRTVVREHRESAAATRQSMRTAWQGLREAVTAEVVNETAIRAVVAEAATHQADAAVLRAETNAAIMALLTADQREELKQLRENARENRAERCGRPGPGRGQGS